MGGACWEWAELKSLFREGAGLNDLSGGYWWIEWEGWSYGEKGAWLCGGRG